MLNLIFTAIIIGVISMPSFAEQTTIKGSAFYRERIALPPQAIFEATLEDVSLMDVAAPVLGEITLESFGQVPIDFEIPYNPKDIKQGHRYNVRARISVGGQLKFITDTSHPVLTEKPQTELKLLMKMVRQSVENKTLNNYYWRLISLNGKTIDENTPIRREPHLIFHNEKEGKTRLSGSSGCNSIMGTYQQEGQTVNIETQAMAMTLMACPEGNIEQEFLSLLKSVHYWKTQGETLLFYAEKNAEVIARFEAVYL